jgi:uncharacterized membrane protein
VSSAWRLSVNDGIFAFPMTLPVLDLRVPVLEMEHDRHDL